MSARPTSAAMNGAERASPSAARAWRDRRRAIAVIGRRDLRALLLGPGGYVALSLGLLAGLLVVRTHLDAIARDRLLALADAFTLPLFIASLVVIFFLTLVSAAGIAREREGGTLETLFYGPVDAWSCVLGKHLALVAGYAAFGLALVALLGVCAAITGLPLGGAFPASALLSVGAAAAMAALGVLCSALMRGARAAIGLLLGIGLLLAALWLGGSLLSGVDVANNTSPLLWLRDLMIGLDSLLGWLSPVATYERGIEAAKRVDPLAYLGALTLLLAQCLAGLVGAVVALRRRGVRP
jgi:ABC-type transport system involved in multi-copper enzyme maturation permease subunit